MVMTAMSEGVDILAASRIFGHHHTTITRWIERYGRYSERLHERLLHRALRIGHLARRRWSVRDLLELPVPEGIWWDTFPATKGCQ
jgi:hypothetical protein